MGAGGFDSDSDSVCPPRSTRGRSEDRIGLDWLAVQRAFVGHPEACAALLCDGATPNSILSRVENQAPHWRAIAERDASALARLGGCVLAWGQADYPPALAALTDPPPVLLVAGRPEVLSRPSLAIVGARAATRSACDHARRFGRELAEQGFVIVSGLARGIDAEAHRGALEAGGVTVAVLACGIDRVYPPEHRALAEEIRDRGAVVGEMPIGTPPRRELFPLRNRVISGLARGVLVVEARRRSGSLITVRHALEQGREVFVVPGSIDGPFAVGSNRLLREGARAVSETAEILDDLLLDDPELVAQLTATATGAHASIERDVERAGGRVPDGWKMDSLARGVLAALSEGPLDREALTLAMQTDWSRLSETLMDLSLSGQVVEERDGCFHRVFGHLAGAT
jgi:DNA processing protein